MKAMTLKMSGPIASTTNVPIMAMVGVITSQKTNRSISESHHVR